MTIMRKLIVNADDFGLSPGVNHGVIQAHERGIVTAASLMVRGRSVAQAVAYANTRHDLSLGIHFDYGEWIYENDSWRPVYELVPADARLVKQEALAQLNIFMRIHRPSTTSNAPSSWTHCAIRGLERL